MLAIAFTDYRKLLQFAPAFYIFGLILLVIVLIPGIGLKINGQRAWIKVYGIGQFQPSEFVKVTTAMMLARYFGKHRVQALAFKEMIVGGLILALPIGLILLEPDVGSVLTYLPILAVVLFLSGIKLRLVIASAVIAVVMIPAAYVVGVKTGMVKGYQQERINVILEPEKADRKGIGYHTWQSILTVGEVVCLDRVLPWRTRRADLSFCPSHIPISSMQSQRKTRGSSVRACPRGLHGPVVASDHRRAARLRSPGMLFIMAFVGGLTFQIFINIGMALGISPVIGVPLPLMSAGLASLIATFIAIGFAISVQLRRFVN